jgi:ATP-binding cassette subfamily B protein
MVTLLSALTPIGLIVTIGYLAGTAPGLARGLGNSHQWSHFELALAILAILIALIQGASSALALVSESLGRRLNSTLRERVMTAMNGPVGISHIDDPEVRDLAAVAKGLRGGYSGPMGAIVAISFKTSAFITSLGAAAILVLLQPLIGVGLFVVDAVIGWWLRTKARSSVSMLYVDPRGLRRSLYFRDLLLDRGPAKEVRAFGVASWLLDCFDAEWLSVMQRAWHLRRIQLSTAGTVILVLGLVNAFAVVGVIRAGISHVLNDSDVIVCLQCCLTMLTLALVSQWDEIVTAGQDSVVATNDLENRIREVAYSSHVGEFLSPYSIQKIELHDVHFSYSADTEVLKGITLKLEEGKSYAFVGRNGSGKSTIVKLLLKLYEPSAGRIDVNGIPLCKYEAKDWRRTCAVVFQDFLRLGVSLREAIELGSWETRGDDEVLKRVLEMAGLESLVDALPNGWNTELNPQIRGGVDLSGGQWQKVAIARSLYAMEMGSKLLMLDEPTASLDADSEREIYESFLSSTAGRTSILVSHRLATVRRVDHIFVIDRGLVLEQGSHAELMELQGTYYEMFSAQASLVVGRGSS